MAVPHPAQSPGWLLTLQLIGGDDVEVGVEGVRESSEAGQRRLVAVELDFPAWASWPALAGCSSTPTSAAFGPETVSCVSVEAPRRALSTARMIRAVQVSPRPVKVKSIRRSALAA